MEVEIETLFCEKSIEEIKQLQEGKKNEIEKKKEEMRQMVGESYRDLIEAADTIETMKKNSQTIVASLSRIHNECSFLKCNLEDNQLPLKSPILAKDNVKKKFFEAATQMKVLVDTPELIWSALESHSILKASLLYLLAKQIFSNLSTTADMENNIVDSFPVLPQQWSSISHFREEILVNARQALGDIGLSENSIAQALTSIVLLDDRSPRQVLLEFLNVRKQKLSSYLDCASSSHAPAKDQLCDFADTIKTTLENIYSIFYMDSNIHSGDLDIYSERTDASKFPLLYKNLYNVSSSTSKSPSSISSLLGRNSNFLLRHLPSSVQSFRPLLPTIRSFIPPEFIQMQSSDWFHKCQSDIRSRGSMLLSYMPS
eukprot:Sdes_comp19809_c0_seq1m11937